MSAEKSHAVLQQKIENVRRALSADKSSPSNDWPSLSTLARAQSFSALFIQEMLVLGDFFKAVSQAMEEIVKPLPETPRSKRSRSLAIIYDNFDTPTAKAVVDATAEILLDAGREDRRAITWLIEGLKTPNARWSQPYLQALKQLNLSSAEKSELVAEIDAFAKLGWGTTQFIVNEVSEAFADDTEVIDLLTKAGHEPERHLESQKRNTAEREAHVKAYAEKRKAEQLKVASLSNDEATLRILRESEQFPILLTDRWSDLIKDPRFSAVISQTFHVPPPHFIKEYVPALRRVYEHILTGSAHDFLLDPDIRSTHARVKSSERFLDTEGPTYRLVYEYRTEDRQRFEFAITRGYDGMHAAIAGWGTDALERYFGEGSEFLCHYRASDPKDHKFYDP